jgi:hypothetical protein
VDYFSIIFCFLSCYDEYLISSRDKHERVEAKDSIISKNNRLYKPNADLIVKEIWKSLKLDYAGVKNKFKSIITFDIDSAWAVKNKGFLRSKLGDFKEIIKRNSIQERQSIRRNETKDPFDTFEYIKETANKTEVICFFLMSDWGKFDKNINWKNIEFQNLIKDLNKNLDIGIHPSYQSYLKLKTIHKELNRLGLVSGQAVLKSRQHFLKLNLPTSYEILDKLELTDDYSMGFADDFGFRAGTCFPFPFFNLNTNKVGKIRIHPITYMDSTLNKYLKLSPEKAISIISELKHEVKNVGGEFIPLWHNETIGESGIWKGWLKVFESNFN